MPPNLGRPYPARHRPSEGAEECPRKGDMARRSSRRQFDMDELGAPAPVGPQLG